MKKVRKGKKTLIALIIVAIIAIAAIFIVVKVVKKEQKAPENPVEEQLVFELPDTTTDSGMDVKKVSMEYRKEHNQTVVTMRITNTTSEKVSKEKFKAILIGPSDDILGSMPTGTNIDLDVGEECEVTVVYSGDLTSTQRIKLDKIK